MAGERTGLPDTARSGSGDVTVGAVVLPFRGPLMSGEVVADPSRLWSGPQVAAALGMTSAAWRKAVSRGYAPPPDVVGDGPARGRRPKWRVSTIREFRLRGRKGQGFRSDLHG